MSDEKVFSTALSDTVLALVAIFGSCIFMQTEMNSTAGIGFLLTGLAALFGTVRFGLWPQIRIFHEFLSALAGNVGIPLIAVAFYHHSLPLPGLILVAVLVALTLLHILFTVVISFPLYSTLIGSIAMLAIIVAGILVIGENTIVGIFSISGSALIAVAGLVIKTEGEWGSMKRVDLFHYALSVAYILLIIALRGFYS